MDFKQILLAAKAGDKDAKEILYKKYQPLLFKWSMSAGRFSEDLYQELSRVFLHCIDRFVIENTAD